ncbi:MAG: hypothetical protein CL902_00105 [Dehalococcoidia bacterium]|nr:hypothetical protein [Dehalococcoidia bacterium]
MKYEKAIEMAEDLRKVADFIEKQYSQVPDIDVEITSYVGFGWDKSAENIPAIIADTVLAGLAEGASVRKDYGSSYFRAFLGFGELEYRVICERDAVCTRRVIGTQMVTKSMTPEGEWTEKEVQEDVVEWDCHPLLAAAKETD